MNPDQSPSVSGIPNVHDLRAGRDLDVLISEQVMGYRVAKPKKGVYFETTPKGTRPLRAYSREMQDAWEVAERLGIALIPITGGGGWFALVGNEVGWKSPATFIEYLQTADFVRAGAAVSETAPLAICLAAFKAVQSRQIAALPPTFEQIAH